MPESVTRGSARICFTGSAKSPFEFRRCASARVGAWCWRARLLEKAASQHGRRIAGFSADAQNAIENYAWPGNVREMENKIKGAVIMAEGKQVTAADLGLCRRPAPARRT